jgi:hypothetical protein
MYAISSYDNRGEGYNRIVDGIVDIGALESQNPIVCFRSDSLVKIRYGLGIQDDYIQCDKLIKNDKVVNNTVNNVKLTYIQHNAITGNTDEFIMIKRNSISPSVPFIDTYFTKGHVLIIDGKYVKAEDTIPMGLGSKVKLENKYDVHTIITTEKSVINVNGIDTVGMSKKQWGKLNKEKHINWRENR